MLCILFHLKQHNSQQITNEIADQQEICKNNMYILFLGRYMDSVIVLQKQYMNKNQLIRTYLSMKRASLIIITSYLGSGTPELPPVRQWHSFRVL